MLLLDNTSIIQIKKLMKEHTFPPFAMELSKREDKSVLVTNGALLFVWPRDRVDFSSKRLAKLFDEQKNPKAVAAVSRIKQDGWYETIFKGRGKFIPVEEMEPDEKEIQKMRMEEAHSGGRDDNNFTVFSPSRSYSERIRINHKYVTLVEEILDSPTYRLFRDKTDLGPLRLLGIYEKKYLAGAVANQLE